MVSKQVGKLTGGTRVPRGVAFTMGVYSERCAVPDSKPLRALIEGKSWKRFEKVLENQNRTGLPGESVR